MRILCTILVSLFFQTFIMMNFLSAQKILPRTESQGQLWISSKFFVDNQENINNFGIDCICSIGTFRPEQFSSKAIRQLFYLEDHQDVEKQQFIDVCIKSYEFINYYRERRKNVLVHCVLGISRSAAICCFYLMNKENLQFAEAERMVKQRRSWIKINKGFVRLLQQICNQKESLKQILVNKYDKDKSKL